MGHPYKCECSVCYHPSDDNGRRARAEWDSRVAKVEAEEPLVRLLQRTMPASFGPLRVLMARRRSVGR